MRDMSLALGLTATQIMTACQLFVASPPAVGWHPHWGEENYVFLQNSTQIRRQGSDLAYCGEFSNIDSDRVWAAWMAPPADEKIPSSQAIIAADDAFEELARFSRENQNSAVMPEALPVALAEPPPLPRPRNEPRASLA
jgi:hypothetical protein